MRFLVPAVAALLAGCGSADSSAGLSPSDAAACPAGTAILSVAPLPLAAVAGWVPLGNLNPPSHTLPTDHQYLYLVSFGAPVQPAVDLVAPGALTIIRARRTTYSPGGHADFSVTFSPCADVAGEFGHVATIDAALAARLGNFDQGCDQYTPGPGVTVTSCWTRPLAVRLAAGERIGTVGGGPPHPASLDFSMWDRRIAPLRFANPDRWIRSTDGFDSFHVVPASDYFAEPARSEIASRVGSFDGRVRRTSAPAGGTIEVDVPGTAQGAWFAPAVPTHPEGPHFAIAPDNVDPGLISAAIGLSQPGTTTRVRSYRPVAAGRINRQPSEIIADGGIYCIEWLFGGIALLRLEDAITLRVEIRDAATNCESQQPWTLTEGASFRYLR